MLSVSLRASELESSRVRMIAKPCARSLRCSPSFMARGLMAAYSWSSQKTRSWNSKRLPSGSATAAPDSFAWSRSGWSRRSPPTAEHRDGPPSVTFFLATPLLPRTPRRSPAPRNPQRFQRARTDSNGRPPDSKSVKVEGRRTSDLQPKARGIGVDRTPKQRLGEWRYFTAISGRLGLFCPRIAPGKTAHMIEASSVRLRCKPIIVAFGEPKYHLVFPSVDRDRRTKP